MKKNMGALDRTVRVLLAIAIAVLYFTGILLGTWAIVLGILAAVFILTSFLGFCPLYAPFGIRTCKKQENEK